MKNCLRQSDIIARLGGDEFVIILNNIDNKSSVEMIVQNILNNMRAPFNLIEQKHVTVSIGITLCPKDSSESLELLKNADLAMYTAKSNGRNNFHFFTKNRI